MKTATSEIAYGGKNELSTGILESVRIEGCLHGLASELTVTQSFHNRGKRNIEAVYTFPLPHGAVLLDLVARIGDRELRGSVLPKARAEESYEDAVSEGHGAIMLERSDAGICTVNLGNLMPGEHAKLTYRFAHLLSWQQDSVKFRLPTTIAPRYGDPVAAGYQPHQIPETSVIAENPFSFNLEVDGLLSTAVFDCPSHKVTFLQKDGKPVISLRDDTAWMDRDLIIDMRLAGADKASALLANDAVSGGQVALASFCPQIPGGEVEGICAKIVVDCSGSMSGDSIEQARAGLHRILDSLRESDTFNVVRFGSEHRAYFQECVPAKGRSLINARREVDNLEADLGGTEMEEALDFTYALEGRESRPVAILLITDGEISNHREVIRKAVKSGHRIFTVGVGSAVAEEFVRGIAAKTGGACELVSPNEAMADAIYRQFRRMFQPRAIEVNVAWPGKTGWQSPAEIGPVFAGDTLHLFAGLQSENHGEVSLKLKLEDGREVVQQVPLNNNGAPWEALARVAAASRIEDLDKTRPALAEELSNQYQLVTRHTNYLILDMKSEDEKAQDMPELVKVAQMLAAGWGGTGTVTADSNPGITPMISHSVRRSQASNPAHYADSADMDYDIPAFYRSSQQSSSMKLRMPAGVAAMRDWISSVGGDETILDNPRHVPEKTRLRIQQEKITEIIHAGASWLPGFRELLEHGLSDAIRDLVRQLMEQEGWPEATLAASLLQTMMARLSMAEELHLASQSIAAESDPGLMRYFEQGLSADDDGFGWNSRFELLPSML